MELLGSSPFNRGTLVSAEGFNMLDFVVCAQC